ncbi:MAG TPA: hypothetical protein VLK32_07890 [Bacillota bacterium]|nr:hypothetical protein [Bacillota bacterium]
MVGLQIVKVDERPGFFHKPEWFRPLLFGENLYMNVTYLLPGSGMVMASKREKEAELLERVIYMLEGRLEVNCDGKKSDLLPHMAMLVPLQPGPEVEVKNHGGHTACFVTVMSPPPHRDLKYNSLERVQQLYREANRPIKTAEEMKSVIAAKKS